MEISYIPTKTKIGTPITLAEAKAQLQIESNFTADDTYIASLVAIAIDKLEADTNSDVLETTNELVFDLESSAPAMWYINQSPLISVDKIEKKVGATWSDVSTTDYRVRPWFSKFLITTLVTIEADQIRITFKTGYAAANMPRVLKGAALLKVADLFTNERQGYTLNVAANTAYQSLISKHIRTYWG